ncbi:MAG: DEAD/DEAH box helicase [Acidimicrobiaceae bacterium]|nr:DEAD/DEAH box helicase [Acidimicrobiaceae bacterium]
MEHPVSTKSPTFAELGVPASICEALARRDIHAPFEIQTATLVDGLAGRDVLGRAPTGSGKTIAFGIPIVANLPKARPHFPTALILAPTRELADQIHVELASFSKPVKVGVVYGGVGYGKQRRLLEQGVDVLVACPGRLEDLIQQGDVDLSDVERVVLDEADRMADMGFMPAVRRILDQTFNDRQTVLFSATLDGDVAKLTRDYQNNPVRHEVGESTPDITLADHLFWQMDKAERTEVTALAVTAEWPAIIFCRTRHGCDRLKKQLSKLGVDAVAIHGGRSQNQRTRALEDFTTSRAQALVATDVAARGIHVDGVTLVVHYDPPEDHKTYVHRSGRTARAGAGGVVVSLLTPDQTKDARAVMRKIDLSEPITEPSIDTLRALANGEPKPERAPAREIHEPRSNGGGNRKGGGGKHKNQRNNNKHGRSGSGTKNGLGGSGNGGGGGGGGGNRRKPKGQGSGQSHGSGQGQSSGQGNKSQGNKSQSNNKGRPHGSRSGGAKSGGGNRSNRSRSSASRG